MKPSCVTLNQALNKIERTSSNKLADHKAPPAASLAKGFQGPAPFQKQANEDWSRLNKIRRGNGHKDS